MAYSSGQTASNVFIDLSNDGTKAQASDSLGASGTSTAIQVSYLTQGVDGATATQSTTINVGQGYQYANTAQGLMDAINGSGLGLTASFTTAGAAGSGATAAPWRRTWRRRSQRHRHHDLRSRVGVPEPAPTVSARLAHWSDRRG